MKSPNATYYRQKADKLFAEQFHSKPCEICGTIEGTVGHHIYCRGLKAIRYDPDNIAVLCNTHHNTSNEAAPHSTNAQALIRFNQWLDLNRPGHEKLLRIQRKFTYKQAAENLKKGLMAWE